MAHGVHVVLQVTLPVVGKDDAAQFAVASKVETGVGGKDEQPGHVPPPDLVLKKRTRRGQQGDRAQREAQRKTPGDSAYLADRHLHDGVEAALRRVQVSRDLLLAHQAVELFALVGELQDVLVAEGAGAVLVAGAGVDQPGGGGADVRHHRLLHKGAKT